MGSKVYFAPARDGWDYASQAAGQRILAEILGCGQLHVDAVAQIGLDGKQYDLVEVCD
jgi:hypothetical protein